MKREVAAEIVDSLKEAGVDFVATLTEANLHDLVMALGEDPAIHHVPVTREEEGIGICAGAYLGGKKPAMVMMNAGGARSAPCDLECPVNDVYSTGTEDLMKSIVSTAATLILALIILPGIGSAQSSRDEKYVIIGTTSKTVGYMAPWVGKIKGFFQAEGVRVDIPILRSATTGVQALVGGSTQFDATTVDAMISAVDKGQELEVIGGIINGATYRLVATKKFQSFRDLKGATIGVSSLTSGSTVLLRLMLEKNGLNYPRDYTLLSMGGTPERFAALESGRMDATLLAAPLSYKAVDLGYTKIGDVHEYVKHYQLSGLVVAKRWGRDNPDTVKRVLRGLIRSFQWLHQNKDEAVSLISSELKLERRYAEAGWEEYVRSNAWPQKGDIDIEGVKTQIQILAQINKQSGPFPPPERYINLIYLRTAQKELGL